MKACLVAIVGLLSLGGVAFSQDYQGADAVLKKATAPVAKASTPAPTSDTPRQLKHDLKDFRDKAKDLRPSEAAKKWLEFVDRFVVLLGDHRAVGWAFTESTDQESNRVGFLQVVDALPPPSSWEVLAQALEARKPEKNEEAKNAVLRAMAHWLTGNSGALKKAMDELDGLPKQQTSFHLNELQWGVVQNSEDGPAVLGALQERLKKDAKSESSMRLQVPDLVSLVGEEKATALLREALRSEKGEISIPRGIATVKLARKLAMEMVSDLRGPQWALAESLDSVSLYEAMSKRFAETDRDRYARRRAQSYYVFGLIAAGRAPEAASYVASLGSAAGPLIEHDAVAAMERSGYTPQLAGFFHDVLEKNPDLPFWSDYVALAAKAGETDKMVALAESSAARTGLTTTQRQTILTQLRRAYLAADSVDKALQVIREEIALEKSDSGSPKETSDDYVFRDQSEEAAAALVRLGDVLGRKDLVDEGVRAVHDRNAHSNEAKDSGKQVVRLNMLAADLIGLNRGPEAEQVLTEALLAAPVPSQGHYITPTEPETLALLLNLYYRAGRADDVLAILTHAPKWYARDLVGILSKSVSTGRDRDYVGLFAADALLQKGHAPEAKEIVNALLDQHAGYDPAYEYLIKLEGKNAIARLDELFARDQFEERPLIWKAKLLFNSGKLDEAEKCARQAITIDPSDGEQGPGRRMMAYSVLADIRERRGDAKEAETLRGAVTAIRHSEKADSFYEAGLIKRAVDMYKEALSHFTDAYCIQSRLALRLAELGDAAGAEEHYRRAYELMPESFGRVESHCFGCERAFDGKKAQTIAEKVFTELAAKRPDKPQVHYLLGYLHKTEERFAEALPEFREAIKLDPQYLNAWKELGHLSEKIHLPLKEREAIAFTTLRLDPACHHSWFRINDVADLRETWKRLEEAQRMSAKAPESLLPLTASAEELRKQEQSKESELFHGSFMAGDSSDGMRQGPGHALSQHHVLEAVIQWFNYGLRSR